MQLNISGSRTAFTWKQKKAMNQEYKNELRRLRKLQAENRMLRQSERARAKRQGLQVETLRHREQLAAVVDVWRRALAVLTVRPR